MGLNPKIAKNKTKQNKTLKARQLFLLFLETGKSKVNMLNHLVLVRAVLGFQMASYNGYDWHVYISNDALQGITPTHTLFFFPRALLSRLLHGLRNRKVHAQ